MRKQGSPMHIEGETLWKAHSCARFLVPGHVEKIAACAFEGFSGEEIHIPESTKRIESHAFKDCTADVIFERAPENVKFHHDAFRLFKGNVYVARKEKGRTLPEICDRHQLKELGAVLARIIPKLFR